jgi:hypothetical protein
MNQVQPGKESRPKGERDAGNELGEMESIDRIHMICRIE